MVMNASDTSSPNSRPLACFALKWKCFKRLCKVWVDPAKLWRNVKTWAVSINNPVRHIHSLRGSSQSTSAPHSPHPCDLVKAGTYTYMSMETSKHTFCSTWIPSKTFSFDESPCNSMALKWLVGNFQYFQWCHTEVSHCWQLILF